MDFTANELKKFQSLYFKYFNIELDTKTARRKFSLLVKQMELVYQPITQAQADELKNLDVNGDEDEQANASG